MWGLKNSGSENNFISVIFSPSEYRGKWLVLVRDIKKQPQVLEILHDLVMKKKANDLMDDLNDAGVPLKKFSDKEDAADT